MIIPPEPIVDYLISIGAELIEEKYVGYKKVGLDNVVYTVPTYTRGICCVLAKFENPPEKIRSSTLYNEETKEYNFFTKQRNYQERLRQFKKWLEEFRVC